MTTLRHFSIELPQRMRRLPVDHRGFPVPWFVQWFDADAPSPAGVGAPDFRVVDSQKLVRAVKERRCWVCGDKLGAHLAFVIGPMCAINRVISEPPSHRECATFSARACPFLSQPRMRRNEKDLPEDHQEAPGVSLKRNPGVACIWITRTYKPFNAGNGVLFSLGEPETVEWYAEGRVATRAEVDASISSGLPLLRAPAEEEGPRAISALNAAIQRAQPLLPAAA